MHTKTIALVLFVLVGCRGTPPTQELSEEHPAHPLAASATVETGAQPFEVTTTYALPGGPRR